MKITITKSDLLKGIKTVDSATSVKALQPVLLNILVETVDKTNIKLTASDLDMTIITTANAQVTEEGKVTIPAKTLNEITAKLPDSALISLSCAEGTAVVNITSGSSKFEVNGIVASEFPVDSTASTISPVAKEGIEIALKPFVHAVKHAGFAASTGENSNLLSGVMCDIGENILEIASTDGNRLARSRQKIESTTAAQLIIPAKTLREFEKISASIEEPSFTICKEGSKVIIKSEKTTMISRLLEGNFPKYNQLIPTDSPKTATINVGRMIGALERVAVMVNEKTNIVTLDFTAGSLKLSAQTPDAGTSEETLDINYKGEDLCIAFNYRYILDTLKNLDAEEVEIGLNTPLSAAVFRPVKGEDMVVLVMPVQIR